MKRYLITFVCMLTAATMAAADAQQRIQDGCMRSLLRFMEYGTDVRTALPSGATGRGSKATYGNRGSLSPRSFFHTLQTDMEAAAVKLGHSLTNNVEEWIGTKFRELE